MTFTGANFPAELSVTEISNALKKTVEDNYSLVRIRGEISGFKRAASGHLYLDLKDDKSVINAVCWKGQAAKLPIEPQDGLEVIVTGKITTYGARSNYQLLIQTMEVSGEGALLKILEDRKQQFLAEGLFDKDRKRKIPRLPEVIGVVTSPTGAVIKDILHRLQDRCPRYVIIYPCRVQGKGSEIEISKGIEFFNNTPQNIRRPDVIIVARGGGSIEDLWAFNEESVVRAVAVSKIPVISAVGHETDTTLIDYVADKRAPTPTAAAEMAVPVLADVMAYLTAQEKRMGIALNRMTDYATLQLKNMQQALPDIETVVNMKTQRLDDNTERLHNTRAVLFNTMQNKADVLGVRLIRPDAYIKMQANTLESTAKRLESITQRTFENKASILNSTKDLLESYSFKKTLQRGFAVVRNEKGEVLKTIESVKNSDGLEILVSDGAVVVNAKK